MESIDTMEDKSHDLISKKIKENAWKLQSGRIRMGFEEKRAKKEHFGNIPFGYMYSEGPGSPIIQNPEEMKLIERMKNLKHQENHSYSAIARILNNERIPSPKSKIIGAWSINTVRNIINRNESDMGMNAKQSWYTKKQQEERNKRSKLIEEWEGMSETMLRTILKMSGKCTNPDRLSKEDMIQLLEKLN
jgi:hypothetical protein